MGIRGTKTWDDVQSWLAAAGTVSAGSYSASGGWTFGPSTLTAGLTHALNGALGLNGTTTSTFNLAGNNPVTNDTTYFPYILNKGFPQGGSASARAQYAGNGTGQYWGLGTDNANNIVMGQTNSTTGIITNIAFSQGIATGLVSLGVAGASVTHVTNGSMSFKQVNGNTLPANNDSTAGLVIGNQNSGSVSTVVAGTSTGNQTALWFYGRVITDTSGTDAAFMFSAQTVASTPLALSVKNLFAIRNLSTEYFSLGPTGAVIAGNSTAANHPTTDHSFYGRTLSLFNNNGASATAQFAIETNGVNANSAVLRLKNSAGATNDVMQLSHGAGITTWRNGAGTELGQIDVSAGGRFILGPASGLTTLRHTIRSQSSAALETLGVSKTSQAQNTANNFYIQFDGSGAADGYIVVNGSGVLSLVDNSDERLKENIRDATYGLAEIMALRPVEFDWIAEHAPNDVKGFIAQEVELVLPESVTVCDQSEKGGYEDQRFLETSTMIPVLVKALQELKQQFDDYVAAHP